MCRYWCVFFFNDTATTEIYTLSLHDALPISDDVRGDAAPGRPGPVRRLQPAAVRLRRLGDAGRGHARLRGGLRLHRPGGVRDRKSTRLNSSHANISYAVFCL